MERIFKGQTDMKIEYDSARDLLYIWFKHPGTRAARTELVSPGVHTDFDREDQLVGIEILDASEVVGHTMQFELELPTRTPDASAT